MKDKITINCIGISEEKYEYLVQFLKDCEYNYVEVDERDKMLDSLGYYVCNDGEELPGILDMLLSYNGNSVNLDEICPELVLWQPVENWDYETLMGAIK